MAKVLIRRSPKGEGAEESSSGCEREPTGCGTCPIALERKLGQRDIVLEPVFFLGFSGYLEIFLSKSNLGVFLLFSPPQAENFDKLCLQM